MRSLDLIKKLVTIVKRLGVIEGLAFFAWLVQTFLEKTIIRVQDKLHLYSYETWIRNTERSTINLPEHSISNHPVATFLIFINSANETTEQEIQITLDSIRKQHTTQWECLFLVPNSEKNIRFPTLIDPACEKIILFDSNEVLDRNSAIHNVLPIMKGDWLIWTRPGDLHSETLLDHLIPLISDIVYWDEDHLVNQRRKNPFMKPDWSPELWISVDLLYCAALNRDLLITCSDPGKNQQIISECVFKANLIEHIPTVLTHCKSMAWEDQQNLHTHQANILKYLQLKGIPFPEIKSKPNASLKVTWQTSQEKISIIIPTKDNYLLLFRCLQSIFQKTSYQNYEIILVDDQSTDPRVLEYYQSLSALKQTIRIIPGKRPFNYSFACNQGAQFADGHYLLFLNNDTEVLNPEWLREMIQFASLKEVGIVGGKLLFPDHTIQHAGIILGLEGHASHVFMGSTETQQTPFGLVDWYRNYSAVTGACMMFRKEVFEELGGYDENYLLVFSDIEICLRAIDHKYRIVFNPDVSLIHHEGKSRGKYIPKEDILLGYQDFIKYCIRGDHYFNPGLSYAWRIPTLHRSWEQSPSKRLDKISKYS